MHNTFWFGNLFFETKQKDKQLTTVLADSLYHFACNKKLWFAWEPVGMITFSYLAQSILFEGCPSLKY